MTESDPCKPLTLLVAQVLRSFSNMPGMPSKGQILLMTQEHLYRTDKPPLSPGITSVGGRHMLK